jgi:hypothetical protein
MLGWFDFRSVDALADGIVADLVKRVPPSARLSSAKEVQRLRRANDVVFARAEAFARAERPGFYRKARLGNRVRWGLRDAGYPAEFADILSEELAAVVTLASRERRA